MGVDTYICIQEARRVPVVGSNDFDIEWVCINEGLFKDFWYGGTSLTLSTIFNENKIQPIDYNSKDYKDYPDGFKRYLELDSGDYGSGIIYLGRNLRITWVEM